MELHIRHQLIVVKTIILLKYLVDLQNQLTIRYMYNMKTQMLHHYLTDCSAVAIADANDFISNDWAGAGAGAAVLIIFSKAASIEAIPPSPPAGLAMLLSVLCITSFGRNAAITSFLAGRSIGPLFGVISTSFTFAPVNVPDFKSMLVMMLVLMRCY